MQLPVWLAWGQKTAHSHPRCRFHRVTGFQGALKRTVEAVAMLPTLGMYLVTSLEQQAVREQLAAE
jgi:hypothetical protein